MVSKYELVRIYVKRQLSSYIFLAITINKEFCNKSLDKRQGSSDWNKDIKTDTEQRIFFIYIIIPMAIIQLRTQSSTESHQGLHQQNTFILYFLYH